MSYQGDILLGDTIAWTFTTVGSSGAPVTISSSADPVIYVDSSTTELSSGVTFTEDFDSRTGLHHVAIEAASSLGFTTGTNCSVVLSQGTADGTTMNGYTIGSFSIANRVSQIADAVWDEVRADHTSSSQFGGIGQDINNLNDLSASSAASAVWGKVRADITSSSQFGGIGPDINAILNDTDLIDDGTSGLAKIATDVAAILVDTGTTLDAKINTIDSIVDAILVDTGTTLDSKIDTIGTIVDAIKAKTDELTFPSTGAVRANIHYVNDVLVGGVGSSADPWSPA